MWSAGQRLTQGEQRKRSSSPNWISQLCLQAVPRLCPAGELWGLSLGRIHTGSGDSFLSAVSGLWPRRLATAMAWLAVRVHSYWFCLKSK